jgi:transposase InsO family protein
MIRYIDMYRGCFVVEPICRVLGATECGFITARGYRAAKARPVSCRCLRDVTLLAEVRRLHQVNYGVYGVRKMHAAMVRSGWRVGRDQNARLMRQAGLQGARRGRRVFTTHPDPSLGRGEDLVNRNFHTDGPNRLWVADITYVATWPGMAYVSFITDVYSRRIVGWSVSSTLRTEPSTLAALDMAVWQADTDLTGLICHNDHGSNYLSMRYTDRVAQLGAIPSTGTVGDAYDNALAETVNGLYKTELIWRRRPWRTVEQVELATLEWVWWWNNQRLHTTLAMATPAEVEQTYYHQHQDPRAATATRETN